jgi:hypothetical protein
VDASGKIKFVYKEVTGDIADIPGKNHKIWISDSYVRDDAVPAPFDIPIAGYGEYHSIELSNSSHFIGDDTAIVFKPLATCSQQAGTGFTNISTIFLSFFYLFSKSLLNCF